VLKDLVPPLLWRAGRRLLRGRPPSPSYQGVSTLVDLSVLHRGRFADVYDAAYPIDPDLLPDGDVMRLRAYNTYLFSEIALRVPGDFVSIGISYGVTPKVLYELLLKGTGRRYHLVDPFEEDTIDNYCDDPGLVMAQFGGDPSVLLYRATAPEAFPLPLVDGMAFAELDTGNERAELASMPYLIDRLTPGGIIVIDNYGWGVSTAPYDEIAEAAGASIFSLPTGQGVLSKHGPSSASRPSVRST
jgi:hypothetical protein